MAALSLSGCFKPEKQGTRMLIERYSQNVEDDPITHSTAAIEGYAFKIKKGTQWEVSSWEDALARCITNTAHPAEQLTEPDIIASYDTESEYQMTFELWEMHTLLVVVDKTNRIYATRNYDTPMNLPEVYTQLHLYAWRKSGSANGWTVTNPFPDEKREPIVPTEDEEVDNEGKGDTADDTADDTTDATDATTDEGGKEKIE